MDTDAPHTAAPRATRVRNWSLALIITLAAASLQAQPATYFASAYGLTGSALKTQLTGIIDGHTTLSYTPGVWDAHKDLYEDPNDSSRIILFYSQASWAKADQDPGSGSEEYWNREHLWANSYGIDGATSRGYTDLFHLVPANKAVNNDRSNNYFDYADPSDPNYEAVAHPIAPQCKEISSVSWEPADGQKGWVARAMLYMDTRYATLELVDSPPDPAPDSSSSRMAQLSVLLEWNRKFLPAAKELYVNQRIYDDYQFNRNPYIDYPEFADAVWVSGPSWGGWRLQHFNLTELLDPAISGDFADPDGDQLVNLIEMARYSDPRVADTDGAITGSGSGNQVTLTFLRATDSSNLNLEMVVEISTDLSGWDPLPLGGATVTPVTADQESVAVTRTPGNPEFYRMRVGRP